MRDASKRTIGHGLVAGSIGYLTVVGFFTFLSLLHGTSPLVAPSAMGWVLLGGGSPPAGVVSAAAVLAASLFHALLSLGAGLAAAWLLQEARRSHELWYVVVFIFLGAFLFTVLATGMFGAELAGAFGWPSVVVSNALWAGAVGTYLYRVHRSRGVRAHDSREENHLMPEVR